MNVLVIRRSGPVAATTIADGYVLETTLDAVSTEDGVRDLRLRRFHALVLEKCQLFEITGDARAAIVEVLIDDTIECVAYVK